jgi:drug/metabolite transporter (DMT)-like permease
MLAGVLLGVGASACWAVANVAVQRSGRRVGAVRALLWAQLLSLPLLAALLPFDTRTGAFGAGEALALLGAGAAALVAYVCMFYAFEHGRLIIAVPLMSGWSVIAAALSIVWLHERVRPTQLLGGAAVVLGALVVSRYAQADGVGMRREGGPRWLLASVAAAVGFGVLIPTLGRLVPSLGTAGAIALVYATDIVLGVPLARLYRVSLAPPRGAWLAAAVSGLFEASGFFCIAVAARHAPLALVSPLSSLAGAITVLYAWIVLRERPRRPAILGAALACGGAIALAL